MSLTKRNIAKKISNELNKPTSESLFLINSFINIIKSNSKKNNKRLVDHCFFYRKNSSNFGIAKAQNIGIKKALKCKDDGLEIIT